jgi:hydrogenase-4 component B
MTTGIALLVAATAVAGAMLVGRWAPRLWLGLTLAGAAAALVAAVTVLAGGGAWEWRGGAPLLGDPLHLRLDGVSAFFLVLLCVVAAANSVYAHQYWADRTHPRSARRGRIWWSVLLLSMALVLLASHGLYYLVGWEGTTVSAYFLITLDRSQREARSAGWLYLAVSHASVLALFAFFAVLAARTGSWDLGPMRERVGLAPLFWLVLFGHGIKAGVFPLHIWLPSAHANAPSHVSAILSGVSIKLGIYGLVRFSGWLPMPAGAGWTVAVLGIASAVLGVAFALGQHNLKRLLAYHSVENIGIILIGLGFALIALESGNAAWGGLALAGGLLHVWNHGLFKSLLFLGAGSVLHATGTREMSRLGGLWRAMPWTTGLFGLGAIAICGLPPLNGFVSELLVFLGLFDAAISRAPSTWAAIPAAVLLGVTGALALACFVKACGVVFLGAARSPAAARAHESGWAMRGAMLALAAACVAIGLAPIVFWPAVATAVGAWRPSGAGAGPPMPLYALGWVHVALAVVAVAAAAWLLRRARRAGWRRAPTWACGFVAPTARMQYTAGSFAGIITGWFASILRPERHEQLPVEPLPVSASLVEHTPETVLRYLVEPVSAVVLRVATAARALQHGGVQSYLLYLLLGIAALACVAVFGVQA